MSKPPSKNSVAFMLAASEVTAKLDTILRTIPALKGAELENLLRFVPENRAVFAGQAKGKPAVFRWFLHARGREAANTEWAELIRAWPEMNGTFNRVPEPLYHDEQAGLMVMERVTGTPLLDLIRNADTETQLEAIARAADWYRAYVAATLVRGEINTGAWISRAATAASRQPFAHLRTLETEILAELHRLASALDNNSWAKAIGHGDFHLNNLLLDGNVLTGFDLGGSALRPMVMGPARALTHMARRDVMPTGKRLFGVDAGAFHAMTKGLGTVDRTLHLPFFIGYEALMRVENRLLSPARIDVAHKFEVSLLEDLKAVAAP